jgi:hypothetical protein
VIVAAKQAKVELLDEHEEAFPQMTVWRTGNLDICACMSSQECHLRYQLHLNSSAKFIYSQKQVVRVSACVIRIPREPVECVVNRPPATSRDL